MSAFVRCRKKIAKASSIVENWTAAAALAAALRVVALNVEEGWSRDVSEAIAPKVLRD